MFKQYIQKQPEVKAIQWTGDNTAELQDFFVINNVKFGNVELITKDDEELLEIKIYYRCSKKNSEGNIEDTADDTTLRTHHMKIGEYTLFHDDITAHRSFSFFPEEQFNKYYEVKI